MTEIDTSGKAVEMQAIYLDQFYTTFDEDGFSFPIKAKQALKAAQMLRALRDERDTAYRRGIQRAIDLLHEHAMPELNDHVAEALVGCAEILKAELEADLCQTTD